MGAGGAAGGEGEGSFVMHRRPAQVPWTCRAGRSRAQSGEGEADGVWKNDIHTLDAAVATSCPPATCAEAKLSRLVGANFLTPNAGVTREPWLPLLLLRADGISPGN